MARDKGDVVDDSHLREGRVAPTNSHKRLLANQAQFRAPLTIRHRGSRSASGQTRDDEDKPVDVRVLSRPVQNGIHIVVEADVPHSTGCLILLRQRQHQIHRLLQR
ncbi:hypothetical protein RYX36_017447 [Vicia faba]